MWRTGLSVALSACVSFTSLGYDFSHADGVFKKRDNGFSKSTEARELYEQALASSLSVDERVYAVTQMSRLDLFRGGMIPAASESQRKSALQSCLNDVEIIKDTNRQEYFYFKVACMGSLGKLLPFMERAALAIKMRSFQHDALAASKDSQGR